jgi:transcriptional regulator with XRE-family HTH domain
VDLYLVRAIKKVSQWELARKTGISQTQISLFERGYRVPSECLKQKISEALEVSVNAIEYKDIRRGWEVSKNG